MDREENEIRFALSVLDDHRRLIAAGKTHRWDIVKWAVTVNIALAGASVTLKHQDENATGLFFFLTLGVVVLCGWLLAEITRRMTAARNDSLEPEKYLSQHGIDVAKVTGKASPEPYEMNYDKQEARRYSLILLASAVPAFVLWWRS
jgi:hypothetical protein